MDSKIKENVDDSIQVYSIVLPPVKVSPAPPVPVWAWPAPPVNVGPPRSLLLTLKHTFTILLVTV